jgi:adenylate cyclase
MFLSQLQAQPTISSVAFGFPDRSFVAAHKLGDSAIEILDIAGGDSKVRIDRYEIRGPRCQIYGAALSETSYVVTDQEWYRQASQSDDENWFKLSIHPGGERPAVALAGPIEVDQKRVGILAIIIELTRVSNFLSQLTVGKSAGAFILDRDGRALHLIARKISPQPSQAARRFAGRPRARPGVRSAFRRTRRRFSSPWLRANG